MEAGKLQEQERVHDLEDEQRWLNLPVERKKAQEEDTKWRAGAAKRKTAAIKREARRVEKEEAERRAHEEFLRKNIPLPMHITDWEKAELNAVSWMHFLGFFDAARTQSGADGGIDVISAGAVAQVKREGSDIGRPALQAFVGATYRHDLRFFFASSGYTKQAIAYADEHNMELFLTGPYGEVSPINQATHRRLERVVDF